MTGFDSTWYHAPFAAGFAQSGETFDLHFIAPQFLAWFYPQNSELLHGIGMLAFSRDLLSPLLNLGWLGGVPAGGLVHRSPLRRGRRSRSAGVALVLDTGALADQAGEARNDIVAHLLRPRGARRSSINAGRRGEAARRQRRSEGAPVAVGGPDPRRPRDRPRGRDQGQLPRRRRSPSVGALVLVAPRGGAAPRALAAAACRRSPAAASGTCATSSTPATRCRGSSTSGPITLPSPEQAIGGREGYGVLHYLTDPG